MSAGLAATQLALAREHRLASLGALATAAAHELGTPLGTIAVVARELERALPANSAGGRGCAAAARAGRTLPRHPRAPRQPGRGDAGRRPRACRLGALLDDIADALSRRGSRHHRHGRRKASRATPSRRSGARRNCCTGWATSSRTPPISPKARARCRRAGTPATLSVVGRGRRPGLRARDLRAHRRALHHLAPRPSRLGDTEIGPPARWTNTKAWGSASSSPRPCSSRPAARLRRPIRQRRRARPVAGPRGVIDGGTAGPD